MGRLEPFPFPREHRSKAFPFPRAQGRAFPLPRPCRTPEPLIRKGQWLNDRCQPAVATRRGPATSGNRERRGSQFDHRPLPSPRKEILFKGLRHLGAGAALADSGERKRSDSGERERVEAGDRERLASRWRFASPRGIGNGRAGEQERERTGVQERAIGGMRTPTRGNSLKQKSFLYP